MLYSECVSSGNISIENVLQYSKCLHFLALRNRFVTLEEPPQSDGYLFHYWSLQGVTCFCTNVWKQPRNYLLINIPCANKYLLLALSVLQQIYCSLF